MSQAARVTSIEALERFRTALCEFTQKSREALCIADLEIRRFTDWLETQLKHWQAEARKRKEEVIRARGELEQRKYAIGDKRGYTEQEIALKKATEKLRYAEEKIARTRHWINALPQAIQEYQGPARILAGMIDTELAQGIAILGQRIESLEAYIHTHISAPEPPPKTEEEAAT